MRLSVIIITLNEARNLGPCLESVRFADEVVVVDAGSSDETVDIARRAGALVEVSPGWQGFGPQKNRALALATGDWVLSLDADERVTPELEAAIRQVLAAPQHQAYDMPRLSNFCGRFIRYSGWWPDRVLRLFRRGTARFSDDVVHEKVLAEGSVGHLDPYLLHYTYPDLDTAIAKMNRYSSDSAQAMHARGKQASMATAIGHGVWTFVRLYLFKRGFLDGRHGFLLAVTAAAGSFYRYAKLSLKQ